MSFFIARFDPDARYAGYNQFDCQHHAINKFVKDSLKKQVRQGVSVAYAALEESGDSHRFAGFFTLVNHSVPVAALSALQLGSLPKIIPCVRLVMLGVHQGDARKGLGRQLINHAFDIVKAGAQSIGSYGMYLDADATALHFYQKLGFKFLEGDKSPDPSPMFIPMFVMA
jgi:GNAT superfamily N-acetyltransferase